VKLLIVSKALLVSAYRRKLDALAKLGIEVVAVVPAEWREGRSIQRLEPGDDANYRLIVSPLRFNGHFHLHYYPQLADIIQQVRPDLIHLDEEPFNLATFLGATHARRAGVPSLFFTWQNIPRRYPFPFSDTERAVYRWAAHALAGSEDAARVLRHKGYQGRVTVVPQFGVDAEVFTPGEPHGGSFTVGFPNRLIAAKAPLLALEALGHLSTDARLAYLGDGPLRKSIEERVVLRGWQDRVSIEARVSSAQMPARMRGFDVVVLPSLTTPSWREQFGRVLIEAMASGVSVVGSDSGEIPQVIGDAGLIVPEGDPTALGEALRRLEQDPELRLDLGQKGRARVLERYTHGRVAYITRDGYEKALERHWT